MKWRPGNKDYRNAVRDLPSLKENVAEILEDYDGFKMLNYQLDNDLLEYLLLEADFRVVFNRRRNLLQTAVSNMIAHQTDVWTKWSMEGPLESYYSDLTPLDLHEVRDRIDWLSSSLAWCESVLDRRSEGSTFRVWYEDFYFSSFADQAECLSTLWDFVGVEPIAASGLEYYLRPGASKLNSPATYAMVPNIQQVNDECGSDEHGWLFEP